LLVQALCIVCLTLALVIAAYHALLAVIALLPRRSQRRISAGQRPQLSFAIVIPAHDEEDAIGPTLESCFALDYPRELFEVFVIADNCSDRTATIADRMGANCLVRHNEQQRGKGDALAWAFEQMSPLKHDAVVVLDADCTLDPNALRVFDARLAAGDRVLQAKVAISNPDESFISLAMAVGNLMENDLFYAPKDRLGMVVFLRGTGIVFRRDVLERIPFRGNSKVEDKEHTLRLLRDGIPVRFVPEVGVRTAFPASREQLEVQRQRWAAGSIHLGKSMALRLMGEGLLRRNWKIADAGWTLLVEIRALLLLQLLLTIGLALLARFHSPGMMSNALLAGAATAVLLHAFCWGVGVLRLGLTWSRLARMGMVGLPVAWLLGIFVRHLFQPRTDSWNKTPRRPALAARTPMQRFP
jgi:cellulose synthase/poly-beta-1,6-N-acetylglucosamine synthase-like glycosyltransferase